MSDKNYKSSNLIKRKKKILHLKIWGLFILVILIVASLAYLSNSDSVKISEVSVNDTTFFNKQEGQVGQSLFLLFSSKKKSI